MTEAEWLACENPQPMLEFLRGKVSERKLRLFACACCRSISKLMPDDQVRQIVTVAEQFADGLATGEEVEQAWSLGWDVWGAWASRRTPASQCAEAEATGAATRAVEDTLSFEDAAQHSVNAAYAIGRDQNAGEPDYDAAQQNRTTEMCRQAVLLRHIFGNPFRPYNAPAHLPSTVVQLAQALYNGQDCTFALHDALLEAGHPELAKHFKDEQSHPKGCWAADLMLRKD
jgi:hypothetical protein